MPSAPVVGLFGPCRPAAIFGFITSIVIDSVDGHSRRRFAHVGKKVLKCKPTVADSDTPAPITRKTFVFRIPASLEHAQPAIIDTCISADTSMSMFGGALDDGLARDLTMITPATLNIPASQKSAHSDSLFSAIAETKPIGRTISIRGISLCNVLRNETAETDSSNVFDGHAGLHERRVCQGMALRLERSAIPPKLSQCVL